MLSAGDAAAALARGFERAGVVCDRVPLGDGGEGTAEALRLALGGEWRSARVSDPLGRSVEARWLLLPDGRGVVESAEAIGLGRLAPEELDPLRASSRGLGELILAVKADELVVGLGGTATVDGGAGMFEVLAELPLATTVLCDVFSPLLDAARLFGPQKGATPEVVAKLEGRLAASEELHPYAELPGAGAAGGLGAAFAALGASLVPGAEFVVAEVGLRERLPGALLAVTGEGKVDRQSRAGKVAAAVVSACAAEGVRCVVFGGLVEEAFPGAEMHALSGDPRRARSDLEALGKELGA